MRTKLDFKIHIIQMSVETNDLYFLYDAMGTPVGVVYNGTLYYYVTNLQGDIVKIRNGSGTDVVTYTYNAWGRVLSTTGTLASTLGTHNPLRYRGYVYDQETGLYYLQSRYYNPTLSRFINADAFAATGQGILGNNMFSYCLNNPVTCSDSSGTRAKVSYDDQTNVMRMPWQELPTGGTSTYRRSNYNGPEKPWITPLVIDAIADAAETYWNAYEYSLQLEMERQVEQDLAMKEFITDRFSTNQKSANTLTLIGSGVLLGSSVHSLAGAVVAGTAFGNPLTGVIGSGILFVAAIFAILAEE